MALCAYICACIQEYVGVHVRMLAILYVCASACMHACMYVRYMCVHANMFVCMLACVCVCFPGCYYIHALQPYIIDIYDQKRKILKTLQFEEKVMRSSISVGGGGD